MTYDLDKMIEVLQELKEKYQDVKEYKDLWVYVDDLGIALYGTKDTDSEDEYFIERVIIS